jgi:hypothetical protein
MGRKAPSCIAAARRDYGRPLFELRLAGWQPRLKDHEPTGSDRGEKMSQPTAKDTPGAVGELVAAGEAEIGVQQIPELAAVPGVEVIGPLPGDLQSHHRVFGGAGRKGEGQRGG